MEISADKAIFKRVFALLLTVFLACSLSGCFEAVVSPGLNTPGDNERDDDVKVEVPEGFSTFAKGDRKPVSMSDTIRFDETARMVGLGYVPPGWPSGTQPGIFDVTIKGVTVSKDIPDGIDPQDVYPFRVADDMRASGRYTEEEIAGMIELIYPIGVCYLFVTYEISNKTQSTIATRCLRDAGVYMFNADRQIYYEPLADRSSAAYIGYKDFSPNGLMGEVYLRLLPGETREVTVGYRLNANSCLSTFILNGGYIIEGEWQFLLYVNGSHGSFDFIGGGWVLDDNKVVYIDFERS